MLTMAIGLCVAVATACWLLALVTGEHSWTDRIWSVVPLAYVAMFAVDEGFDVRSSVWTGLVVAWGARLTFNFWRKGGYARGGEDYRWGILRARMTRWQFELFNIFFVAGYQNALLLLIALPAWAAAQAKGPLGPLDVVAWALFVAALVGELIADQKQSDIHQAKKAALARGEVVDPPFCTTGLWRYSRHPNFLFEQSQWWALYLGSVAAGAGAVNATIVGPVLLTLLFDGSTRFTEAITAGRYPSYADYQRTTSRWIPWPPRTAEALAAAD